MMEAVCTPETSVENHFTRQYIPEDNSEHHTRRRENLKSHNDSTSFLYGCETWSVTLREEHSLRAFENRVLSRIFGPKWDEVTGKWRKLHNEELHNLYLHPDIIRQIK
jgi:hypothetical protein